MGRRGGDWFFYGAASMLIASRLTDFNGTVLFVAALAIGWAINEAGRKRDA